MPKSADFKKIQDVKERAKPYQGNVTYDDYFEIPDKIVLESHMTSGAWS